MSYARPKTSHNFIRAASEVADCTKYMVGINLTASSNKISTYVQLDLYAQPKTISSGFTRLKDVRNDSQFFQQNLKSSVEKAKSINLYCTVVGR